MPEDAPPWPSRLCIRQITAIQNHIVDDRECEFWDIPLIQNRNIPIPGLAVGIGEPMRLIAMQRAQSRMLGAIVNHSEYFKAPLTVISQSMYDSLPANQKGAYIKPGARFIVADELYARFSGKPFSIHDPPTTPPGLIQALEVVANKMDKQSGRSDLQRGEPSPDAKSGKAIGYLQQAASSVIDYKHVRAGRMRARLGRLELHSIVHRMTTADLKKIVSRYKDHILHAIHERGKRSDWDIEVEETAGGMHAKQMKTQDAIEKWQAGLISRQTCCERIGEDFHQETRRQRKEARLAAPAAGQPGQEGQAGQPQQSQQKKPPNQGGQAKPA